MMSPQEFDDALKHQWESGISGKAPDWSAMNALLDQPPKASRKVSRTMIWTWSSLGAAAAIAALTWSLQMDKGVRPILHPTAESTVATIASAVDIHREAPQENRSQAPAPSSAIPTLLLNRSTQYSKRRCENTVQTQSSPTAIVPLSENQPTATETTTASAVPEETRGLLNETLGSRKLTLNDALPEPAFEDNRPPSTPLALGIQGGWNPASGPAGFMAGLTVRRELGKRAFVESGVSIVGGIHENQRMVVTASIPNAVTNPVYEKSRTPITYAQINPAIGWQVSNNLSAGIGPDLQRRLNDSRDAVVTDELGQPTASFADWDFGLTMKADWALGRRTTIGASYRSQLGTAGTLTAPAVRRDYLLLQLQFRLTAPKK
jgi:hypothetical protein